MTDKELLELAAKAAGYTCKWNADSLLIEDEAWHEWNPLTDDGDALRLAVKLKIDVVHDFDRVIACYGDDEFETEYFYEKPTPTDPFAATRRAITHAAAEIGKTLDK